MASLTFMGFYPTWNHILILQPVPNIIIYCKLKITIVYIFLFSRKPFNSNWPEFVGDSEDALGAGLPRLGLDLVRQHHMGLLLHRGDPPPRQPLPGLSCHDGRTWRNIYTIRNKLSLQAKMCHIWYWKDNIHRNPNFKQILHFSKSPSTTCTTSGPRW